MADKNIRFNGVEVDYGTIGQNSHLFTVKLQNTGEKAIPASRLWIRETDYLIPESVAVPSLQGYGKTAVKLEVQTHGKKRFEDIKGDFTLDLRVGETVLASKTYYFEFRHWGPVKMLSKYKLRNDAPLNILIFGLAGAGKSALINTFLTLLSDSEKVVIGANQVGATAEHCTKTLRKFAMSRYNLEQVNLWDTWGLDPKTYQGKVLEELINGRLPEGWEMSFTFTDKDKEYKKAQKNTSKRAISVVLFLVPVGALEIPDQLKVLREKFELVARQNLQPLLLLARIDDFVPAFRANPFLHDESVERIKATAAESFRIPPNTIFPCVPYVSEEERVYDIDRLAFKILEKALQSAQERDKWAEENDDDTAIRKPAPSSTADSWGVQELARWLGTNKVAPSIVQAFVDNQVDGPTFLQLDAATLEQDLKVGGLHKAKILGLIKQLNA